jgi:transcriptional regulator with GAF, ATPase, and Fis domain
MHDDTEDRTRTAAVRSVAHLGAAKAAGRLVVAHPRHLATRVELEREPTQLGRRPSGTPAVLLADPTVSRDHARIQWDGRARAFVIEDLGSHNGTSVDGVALEGRICTLADGAVIRLGDVLAVFEDGGLAPAAASVSRDAIPGDAPAMGQLRQQVALCAGDPSPALIIGETGAGKERVAAEVHRLSGRSGRLEAVNCAALSPQLVESQLFGHVKGAFTGADSDQAGLFRAADGGTLFLDEVGELPLEQQTKFLRVLEDHQVTPLGSTRSTRVDVRVVAATNADLYERVQDGSFRRDLYARLAMWEIRVPPLRQRRGDILQWLDRLYTQWCRSRGTEPSTSPTWSINVAEILVCHAWPENLRGLNRLIHAVAPRIVANEVVRSEDLPQWLRHEGEASAGSPAPETDAAPTLRRPAPSRDELLECLEEHDWSVRSVARHFDRDRRQIYRWMKQFELERP